MRTPQQQRIHKLFRTYLWCSAWEALTACREISHREGMQCWYTGIRVRIRILCTRMMLFRVCRDTCIYTLHQSSEEKHGWQDNRHWVAFILCLFPSKHYSSRWNCSQCQRSIVRILFSLWEKLSSTTIGRLLCSHKKIFPLKEKSPKLNFEKYSVVLTVRKQMPTNIFSNIPRVIKPVSEETEEAWWLSAMRHPGWIPATKPGSRKREDRYCVSFTRSKV